MKGYNPITDEEYNQTIAATKERDANSVRIGCARADRDYFHVYLTNSVTIAVPYSLFRDLAAAPESARRNIVAVSNGTALHWPDCDYQMTTEALLHIITTRISAI